MTKQVSFVIESRTMKDLIQARVVQLLKDIDLCRCTRRYSEKAEMEIVVNQLRQLEAQLDLSCADFRRGYRLELIEEPRHASEPKAPNPQAKDA